MSEKLDIPKEEKNQIPKTAKGRIKALMELSIVEKVAFLPTAGQRFRLGPYIYRVKITSPGKLRFTAALDDVVIDGVSDGTEKVSEIVDPNTLKGIVKNA